MSQRVAVANLMATSGVKFGTSGARGLVSAMTDEVCFTYTLAFLQHLAGQSGGPPSALAIGGDRRPSTPRILTAIAAAARHAGVPVHYLGLIPSPAVALYGLEQRCATVMVTGSHIPADRNGMKYTTAFGEITKEDEAGFLSQTVSIPQVFDGNGMLEARPALGSPIASALEQYRQRYLAAFPAGCLKGLRIGVYGHSAVGRDLLCELYESLGAQIVRLGYSEDFIPVDTEAIRPEDDVLAQKWAPEERLDAIVSTDGDSDRPLIAGEDGRWFRGDVAGILVAQFFGADGVACPVSCNGALELSGSVPQVKRTRIGSPYVIAGMQELVQTGLHRVVGYEANGGFLHESPLTVPGGQTLRPLPTRDPIIVHLALLLLAQQKGLKVSQLGGLLPPRITASGRDQAFSTERSRRLLGSLESAPLETLGSVFRLGQVTERDLTDGLRLTFESGEVLHLRPSGNAPELRCYAESPSAARSAQLVEYGLEVARREAAENG
jgi:phosphomannomutase